MPGYGNGHGHEHEHGSERARRHHVIKICTWHCLLLRCEVYLLFFSQEKVNPIVIKDSTDSEGEDKACKRVRW